jgi:hypothetical protein
MKTKSSPLSPPKNIYTEICNSTVELIHNNDLMNNPDIIIPDIIDTW